jgi:hypothetical protein
MADQRKRIALRATTLEKSGALEFAHRPLALTY